MAGLGRAATPARPARALPPGPAEATSCGSYPSHLFWRAPPHTQYDRSIDRQIDRQIDGHECTYICIQIYICIRICGTYVYIYIYLYMHRYTYNPSLGCTEQKRIHGVEQQLAIPLSGGGLFSPRGEDLPGKLVAVQNTQNHGPISYKSLEPREGEPKQPNKAYEGLLGAFGPY